MNSYKPYKNLRENLFLEYKPDCPVCPACSKPNSADVERCSFCFRSLLTPQQFSRLWGEILAEEDLRGLLSDYVYANHYAKAAEFAFYPGLGYNFSVHILESGLSDSMLATIHHTVGVWRDLHAPCMSCGTQIIVPEDHKPFVCGACLMEKVTCVKSDTPVVTHTWTFPTRVAKRVASALPQEDRFWRKTFIDKARRAWQNWFGEVFCVTAGKASEDLLQVLQSLGIVPDYITSNGGN